jgi:hypothetical protein
MYYSLVTEYLIKCWLIFEGIWLHVMHHGKCITSNKGTGMLYEIKVMAGEA